MGFLDALVLDEQAVWAVIACIAFMVLDVVSGIVKAAKNGELSSTKMREGLYHKGGMVFCLVTAWMIELFVEHVPDVGYAVPLLVPAAVLIVCTEVSSVLENAAEIAPELAESKIFSLFKKIDD